METLACVHLVISDGSCVIYVRLYYIHYAYMPVRPDLNFTSGFYLAEVNFKSIYRYGNCREKSTNIPIT